jgi:phosphatidylinositol alpha-1,6-mannosyltransferase
MERFACELHRQLALLTETPSIVNRRGKRALPAFLPYATAAAVRRVRRGGIDVVHIADALLAPSAAIIKALTGMPVTVSLHGLDVTYPNRFYQPVVCGALKRLDAAIANSTATQARLREHTGRKPDSYVVPLGVNPLSPPTHASSQRLEHAIGSDGRPVILTVGRLVERKGVAWFVRNVLPRLSEDVLYVVVGEGKEQSSIVSAAAEAGVRERIRCLGRVDDGMLAAAYARADVFVMPNIPVPGDMEGFGLVALEAAASGVPVVAAELEGIRDAVRHERNGFLVPPLHAKEFAARVQHVLGLSREERRALGTRTARYTVETYGWERTARRYMDVMEEVVARSRVAAGRPFAW